MSAGEDFHFPTNIETIYGRKVYGFFHEVCAINKITDFCHYAAGGVPHQRTHICTLTIIRENRTWEVTGLPANSKNQAKNFAAAMAMKKLGMGQAWYDSAAHNKFPFPLAIFEQLSATRTQECNEENQVSVSTHSMQRLMVSTPASSSMPLSLLNIQAQVPTNICTSFVCNLEDFCSESNNLEGPLYTEPKFVEGMSHNPMFTITCTVKSSSSAETFVAKVTAVTNKKNIKHLVAQKMLIKLHLHNGLKWNGPPLPKGDMEQEDVELVTPVSEIVPMPSLMTDSFANSNACADAQTFHEQDMCTETPAELPDNPQTKLVSEPTSATATSSDSVSEPKYSIRDIMVVSTSKIPAMANSLVGDAIEFLAKTPSVLTQENAKGWVEKVCGQQNTSSCYLEWVSDLPELDDDTSSVGLTIFHPIAEFSILATSETKEVATRKAALLILHSILKMRGAMPGVLVTVD